MLRLNLGALESPPDSRDLALGKVQAPVSIPETYLPDLSPLEIYYQSSQPACGGHAGAYLAQLFDYLETGQVSKLSPRYVYALCKKLDGIPNVEGTYLRVIMKVLKGYGVCDAELFPNDVSLSKEDYKDSTSINQDLIDNGAPRQIGGYAFVDDRSFEGLKQAIYQNKAVIVLKRPWLPGKYPDGHFFVLVGYEKDRIKIANSFGADWEEKGYGWLTRQDCQYIIEAATAIDLPNEQIRNLIKQRNLLTYLRDLYRQLLWLKGIKPIV